MTLLIDILVLQLPGLDGQELSLKLHHDGQLGSFEDSSGKYQSLIVVPSPPPQQPFFVVLMPFLASIELPLDMFLLLAVYAVWNYLSHFCALCRKSF